MFQDSQFVPSSRVKQSKEEPLKMGFILKHQQTTVNIWRITFQKSDSLNYGTAEASNLAFVYFITTKQHKQ